MRHDIEQEGLYVNSKGDFKSIEQIQLESERKIFPDKKERNLDFDRVTRYLQEGQEIMSEFEIGQREATYIPQVEFPDLPLVMLCASDLHYGSLGVNYPLLLKHLTMIEELPNFCLATNGDEVDAFNAVFHPTGMTENPLPPQIQSRAIAQKLLKLDSLGKIAVISQGNHNRSGFAGGQDWYDSFLGQFRCPIFTQGGILNIVYGDQKYRGVMNHTYWGKSKLNPTNAVKRMVEYEGGGDVDFGWVGHVHQGTVENFERAGKDVLAVVSGTYKEVDKWASQNGIGGRGQKGGIALMMFPHEKRMEGFKDIQSAVDLMVRNYD
jgi:hypothetical protein